MTTRQKIKELRGSMTVDVPADELGEGETIKVRRPSAGERRDMLKKFFQSDGSCKPGMEADLQIHIVKKFCVSDDGGPLFDDKDSLEETLDSMLVDRINDAFLKLNRKDSVEVEQLEKN